VCDDDRTSSVRTGFVSSMCFFARNNNNVRYLSLSYPKTYLKYVTVVFEERVYNIRCLSRTYNTDPGFSYGFRVFREFPANNKYGRVYYIESCVCVCRSVVVGFFETGEGAK